MVTNLPSENDTASTNNAPLIKRISLYCILSALKAVNGPHVHDHGKQSRPSTDSDNVVSRLLNKKKSLSITKCLFSLQGQTIINNESVIVLSIDCIQ